MPSIINIDNGQISGTPAVRITAAGDGVLQIQNSGTTAINVDASGNVAFANTVTFNSLPYQQIPILSCSFASQTVTNGAATLFTDETVEVDNYGWWTAGDHRWTAQIPGWYEMHVYTFGAGTTNVALIYSRIQKNGSIYATGSNRTPAGSANLGCWISRFVHLDAGEYLQAIGQVYGSGTLTMNGHAQIKLLQRDPV